MAYYRDLRAYIQVLEEHDKLVRIKREINKDSELMALVRLEFRGLPEKDRKAFLFEHVTDAKGKQYDGSVLVACHAPSREVYALAMATTPDNIVEKWQRVQLNPIKPVMVDRGPVQEVVHVGDSLLEHEGLAEFPIPIFTPGFESAPYFTAGNFVTKDPETGIRNVGNHRAMLKSPTRTGAYVANFQHMQQHWEKYRRQGVPMPCAVVIGPTPNVGLAAVTKFAYGVDEFDIAGAIAGEPVQLVKCKTVDLEVPASAEIVIEGEIPTDASEWEGPFGEFTGYMGPAGYSLFLNVKCITHRERPIWNAFISQFPPSESSIMTQIGEEAVHYKLLKYDLGIDNVVDVGFHLESGGRTLCVVSLKHASTPQVWQALYGICAKTTLYSKIILAVDDDIDPRDMDSVAWALCYRMQPHRDMHIAHGKAAALDPSAVPPEEREKLSTDPPTTSLLIDATRKWVYPPTSLPRKDLMERALEIWREEGLPELKLRAPWYGESLGDWSPESAVDASLALRGEYFRTGEKLERTRRPI